VEQLPPEQLLHEELSDENPSEELFLKLTGANTFTILLLPHFSHLISLLSLPLIMTSEISSQSSHL